ncbi:MAG TPA: hypothetical protein VL201_05675 [Patescibacteria group bacterium]|jgi:type II secretory pathway component PulJ|nr:hypothetical protein [Patescibacteria group bacterium]
MNRYTKGFMLLEVVVGTMIASVISMILMNALGQMTQISLQVDEMYEKTFQLMMIHHQFERDIMGMCVPIQGVLKEEKPTIDNNKNADRGKNTSQKGTPSVQKQSIKKVFFAAMSNTQQMQQLTFITNNPVPQYWQGTVGSAKPKIVRVLYYLQPDKLHPESLTLIRQESTNLHAVALEKDATKAKGYAVANHIQSFSLTFSYETVQSDTKTAQKTEPAQVNSWNSDELLDAAHKKEQSTKKYASLLPKSITIAGALWNQNYTKTTPFSVTIPVLANGFNAPLMYEPDKNQKPQPASDQSKKEQSSPNPVALEVDSMEEVIKAFGGQTQGTGIIVSDVPKKMYKHNSLFQAPVVEIPYDHIEIAFPH